MSRDVLLAVEIMSPGTRGVDRVTKPAEYAEAGIPHYWLVDLDPPVTLTAHLLVDGAYEVVAEGTGVLDLSGPAPVRMDVAGLLSRGQLSGGPLDRLRGRAAAGSAASGTTR